MRFLRATAHTPFQPVKPMQRRALEPSKASRATGQSTSETAKAKTRG